MTTKTPIVFIHGFSGHADSWKTVRSMLLGRETQAVTLFGHDHTAPATQPIAFDDEVDRVASLAKKHGRPVRLCGYSLGGRIALGIIARHPDLVRSAVIIGAHPGLESEEERVARRANDDTWAKMIEDEGVARFAEKWQAQALFASQAELPRATLEAQDRIRLRHDARSLALAMRCLGLGEMPSRWETLRRTEIPLQLVVGARDTKFSDLANKMRAAIPSGRADVIRVDDVGHNVVLEDPESLAEVVDAAT